MKNGMLAQRLNDSIYSIGTELQKSDGTEDNDQETTIELVRWKQERMDIRFSMCHRN